MGPWEGTIIKATLKYFCYHSTQVLLFPVSVVTGNTIWTRQSNIRLSGNHGNTLLDHPVLSPKTPPPNLLQSVFYHNAIKGHCNWNQLFSVTAEYRVNKTSGLR